MIHDQRVLLQKIVTPQKGDVLSNFLRKTGKRSAAFLNVCCFYSNSALHFHCSPFFATEPPLEASPKAHLNGHLCDRMEVSVNAA
jgi:hypothetical protein